LCREKAVHLLYNNDIRRIKAKHPGKQKMFRFVNLYLLNGNSSNSIQQKRN